MGRSGGPRVVATAWLAVVAVLFLGAAAGASAGATAESDESGALDLVNQERAARGLGRLAPAPDLVTVARRHSARMAEANQVFHNSRLSSEVDGWELLGENVGVGPAVQKIHDALMASKVHRDVILEPRFTQIGVGAEPVVTDTTTPGLSRCLSRSRRTSLRPVSSPPVSCSPSWAQRRWRPGARSKPFSAP